MAAVSKRRAFLAVFRETGIVAKAAKIAQVKRREHYRWLKDPDYAAAFAEAREEVTQTLEDEAVRRALDGVEEPVFYKGVECGKITRYSDTLLLALLRAWQPKRWRDHVEVGHKGSIAAALIAGRERVAAYRRKQLEQQEGTPSPQK